MPRTEITKQTPLGPYPGTIAAEALDITWTAGDVANGNDFTCTGRELILVRNDDAGAQTFTVDSVPGAESREGDLTAYSVGIDEYAAFWVGNIIGWKQSDGKVHIAPASANLFFAIIKIP